MTDTETVDPGPAENLPRSKRLRRWVIGGGIVVALLIVVGLYLGYLAMKAKSELESARSHAAQSRAMVLDGDIDGARVEARATTRDAEAADSRTNNPVWVVASSVPWIGQPLDSVRSMTGIVKQLSQDVLEPTADVGAVLDPDVLRSGDSGVDIAVLAQAEPKLAEIAAVAEQLDSDAASVDSSWLGPVADAKDDLADQTADTATLLRGTATAAQLLPPMLGGDGPRNYFFGFQTPAESRGTGGLLGGYGVVNVESGQVNVEDLDSNASFSIFPEPVIDHGDDYDQMYGLYKTLTDVRNSNITTDFPQVAQTWMAMWQKKTGQQLDGAIATDPIALSYLLEATGPITLPDGEEITADNVVEITLSTSYTRFADNNAARKAYLQQIAGAAVSSLTTASGNTGKVLEALGRAVQERRLMIYSAVPEEQALLEQAGLANEIPETDAPYANLSVLNMAGNKIDYYLERDIKYTAGSCDGDRRDSEVVLTLTNTVDDLSLPPYVVGALAKQFMGLPPGTNYAKVNLDATTGATIRDVLIDGVQVLYQESGTEMGHPQFVVNVEVSAGKTSTITFLLNEPTSPGEAQVPVQPLVDNPDVTVDVPTCG